MVVYANVVCCICSKEHGLHCLNAIFYGVYIPYSFMLLGFDAFGHKLPRKRLRLRVLKLCFGDMYYTMLIYLAFELG